MALWAAACGAPAPAPPPTLTAPSVRETAPPPAGSPGLPSPAATARPTRPELIVCLAHEPATLFRYAPPEPDGNASREHILAALEDGPIDRLGSGPHPVLLDELPSLAGGGARLDLVPVQAGDRVVDALGRVVTLTAGVRLNVLAGEQVTYTAGVLNLPQLTLHFAFRPGLRWSDGAPLRAADSVFGFEIAAGLRAYTPDRGRLMRSAAYRALDENTVEWVGLPGYLDPDYAANLWPPLPRHQWEGQSAATLAADPAAGRTPLSYGPFMIASWPAGDRLVLERNPNYWRAAEGLPRLDRVVYRFIPDPAELGRELTRGACDVAPSHPGWQALADVPALARWAPAPRQESLFFGLGGIFGERRARLALVHCLDRAALTPPPSVLERRAARPLFPSDLAEIGFDPARGRALLGELGWRDTDADGRLDRAGGSLRLRLVSGPDGDPARAALAGGLRDQLRSNCGIDVDLQWLTEGELLADWPDGPVFGRRFDLALLAWRTDRTPCAPFLSEQVADEANPAGANLAGYQEPAFDRACRRALAALDPAQAAAAQAEAQAFLARDLALVPLFSHLRLAAARPEVQGLALDPVAASELWNIEVLVVEGTD